MCKLMREIGTRGYKNAPNFEEVSWCSYDKDPRRLEEILGEVEDILNMAVHGKQTNS